ncbi:integrase [Peribacillus frigoritolerans]|uniref:phage lytic cycle repressor MrpR family protein n=1 Tax=Peribacillus TaxID=2675229 RepID=UPI00209F5F59|nr:HNH endonuclease [Peribacillus frigoritolerans]MCP1494567.1 integrase [Peribacillus frigoritolerans]
MFYNDKFKSDFIKYQKDSYERLSRSVFAVSQFMEEELEKDLYDFNLSELSELMSRLGSTSVNSSRDRYYTIFNYINRYKNFRTDKSNPFLLVEPNWHKQFVDKTKSTYFTEEELNELIIDKCVNAQDSVIFRLLFEGVWGKPEYKEILNLKNNDIDWENNELSLNDGKGERKLKVSEKCMSLLKRAIDEKVYYFKNGNAIGYRKKDFLVSSNYVVKGIDPGARNKRDRDSRLIIRRLDSIIKDVLKYPNVDAFSLRLSGMLKTAVDISIDNNIPVKEFNHNVHWYEIAKRFNVKPYVTNGYKIYKGVTDNINSEKVKELYGELDDYKIKDFELIEDNSDVETIERKKRIDAPAFKDSLIKIYDECVITGESFPPVLQGCHIQNYVNGESNHIQNGLLLRSDIHKLFDDGYIIVDENYIVRVSPVLKSDYYQSFDGIKIRLPKEKRFYPSQKALKDKMQFFKSNLELNSIV